MTKIATTDRYAGDLLKDLRRALRAFKVPMEKRTRVDVKPLLERAVMFLNTRLTDAAKGGCHHCDDVGEAGATCWWCGLKRKGR